MTTKVKSESFQPYLKLIGVVLLITIFYIGYKLGSGKSKIVDDSIPGKSDVTANVLQKQKPTITNTDIQETNFTGKVSIISGSGVLATKAKEYVDTTVAEFKAQADKDVPAMRKDFGADSPSANYTLNIEAKYLDNTATQSIVVSVYTFTGGAHGSSYYKVFTGNGSQILSISDLVKSSEQQAFVSFVKKELYTYRVEGASGSPLFSEVVEDLTLGDFENWSLDDKNLVIYFSQYAVGPGVLGSIEFKIPRYKIERFFNQI